MLQQFLTDVRYALRSLWQSKAFAAVAILCLGFGIGLNTTIFSIVDGVLLKPFPYTDPDRLFIVEGSNQRIGATGNSVSYLDLRDLPGATTSFAAMGGSQTRSLTISDGGEPQRYVGAAISWNLFPMLGVEPVLGHGFSADDDKPGSGNVVLLSDAVWTARYHSDPNVIGKSVLVNGTPSAIVGVMPPKFQFPQNQQLWIPLSAVAANDARKARSVFSFARLKPGVTVESAQADLTAASARLAREFPEADQDWTNQLTPLRVRFIPQDVTLVIWLMMAGVTLVLLIACSNVANLLLARASARRREIAVRTAIGAGRARILRQLLTESVTLALVSVPLGVLLAEAGTRLIADDMPPNQVPYYITWTVDWRSLAYTVAIAVVTAVIFGLAPALQMTRGNLHEHLKEGTRGNSARRSLLRSTLVVTQVSLALVALVGALLFVRTFQNLGAYDFGFDVSRLMTMRFYMPGATYDAPDAKLRRVQDVVQRVEAIPGVEAAFGSNLVLLSGGGGGGGVFIEGRPPATGAQPGISLVGTTPHYLKTIGAPLLAGRDFTDAEGFAHDPVAIVSQSMAKQFWPDGNVLGHRFRLDADDETGSWFTIIGVSRDVRLYGVNPQNNQPTPVAYVPYAYQQTINTGLTVRVSGSPASVTTAVREALRGSDPNLPMFSVQTMDDVRKLSYWQYGLYGWIFGTIGVVGLLLAAVGVYGVLSYSVAQRTQEIGVRVALGAGRASVLTLILGYGLTLAGIGVVVGLGLSAAAMPFARSLLFAVSPFDPITFATVAGFLIAVALVASCAPALRATRVDPVIALRGE
jgi:putative ABC transport system permease protein